MQSLAKSELSMRVFAHTEITNLNTIASLPYTICWRFGLLKGLERPALNVVGHLISNDLIFFLENVENHPNRLREAVPRETRLAQLVEIGQNAAFLRLAPRVSRRHPAVAVQIVPIAQAYDQFAHSTAQLVLVLGRFNDLTEFS